MMRLVFVCFFMLFPLSVCCFSPLYPFFNGLVIFRGADFFFFTPSTTSQTQPLPNWDTAAAATSFRMKAGIDRGILYREF